MSAGWIGRAVMKRTVILKMNDYHFSYVVRFAQQASPEDDSHSVTGDWTGGYEAYGDIKDE